MLFRNIIRLVRSLIAGGQGPGGPAAGAPELSSLNVDATGSGSYAGTVHTDDVSGTLFWVVTGSIVPPSIAQIKNGQDHLGATAAADGEQLVNSGGNQFFTGSGLLSGQTYFAHLVQTDGETLNSNIISSSAFATDGAGDDFTGSYAAMGAI